MDVQKGAYDHGQQKDKRTHPGLTAGQSHCRRSGAGLHPVGSDPHDERAGKRAGAASAHTQQGRRASVAGGPAAAALYAGAG